MCLWCMVPLHVAPELMAFGGDGSDEGCHFLRQPSTPEEVEQAIAAVEVSCCGAVGYAGTDRAIIQRLTDGAAGRVP